MSKAATIPRRQINIDCSQPASDNLMSPSELQAHLLEKIKTQVGRKTDLLNVETDSSMVKVDVRSDVINKQSVKTLIRRFLHIKRLSAFIKVYASDKDGFVFKYINVADEDEE